MKHLTNLFKLIELTRSQPQYGYALSGVQQDEMSNFVRNWAKDILKKEIPEILYESGDK